MSNFSGMQFMGTGKTQKMLEDARDAMLAGEDVLIITANELHSRQLAKRFRDLVSATIHTWDEERRAKMGKGRIIGVGEKVAGSGPWSKVYADHFFIESQARLTFDQWRQVVEWFGEVTRHVRTKLEQRVTEYEENVPGPAPKKA